MSAAFSMALREIASLCDRGKNAVAAPAAAVQPPLVFSTTMEASDKAKLPASVVKFKDGTFMTTPCQKRSSVYPCLMSSRVKLGRVPRRIDLSSDRSCDGEQTDKCSSLSSHNE